MTGISLARQSLLNTVSGAYAYAAERHHGQTDKQGRDYLRFHLVPVAYALAPFGDQLTIAGFLHDVVEDTEATLEDLRLHGADPVVVDTVDGVTRRTSETYRDLIGRCCATRERALTKLADNTLNLYSNRSLALSDPAAAASMREGRYLPARERLTAALKSQHDLVGAEVIGDSMLRRIHRVMTDDALYRTFVESINGSRDDQSGWFTS